MGMPTGDTPQTAQQYYLYLQGHQLAPHGRTETWHVDWTAIGWLWGFVVAVILVLFVWIREYRSHRPADAISPLDRWGGYATEAAGRVPISFWVFALIIVGFGAEFVIGHLIAGQEF